MRLLGAAACLAGALPALLAATPPVRSAPGTARSVVVERPGTVRLAIAADGEGGSSGFRVRGPAGEEVAWRLLELGGGGGERSARVVAVSERTGDEGKLVDGKFVEVEGGGWDIDVDAGPAPPRHQALRLPLALPGLATVELLASDDRREWQPLASASLFRLGGDRALQGSAIAYAATSARYLRLAWPAAAGFPRLTTVALDVASGPAEELPLAASACAADGNAGARGNGMGARAVCTLTPPVGRPLQALELALPAGRAAAWRLREAVDGRWRVRGEGAWAATDAEIDPSSATSRRVPLGGTAAGPLRLELWGAESPPLPERVVLLATPLALEIEAPVAGTYEWVSGPGLPRPPPVAADPGAGEWLTPGAPRAVALPPLSVGAAGGPLPDVPFRHSWALTSAASAGELVRLELPPEVLVATAAGQGDLRVARDGRQVPYVVSTPALPAAAGAWARLAPTAGRQVSAAEVSLDPALARLGGTLLLRAPPATLRRNVRLIHQAPGETHPVRPPTSVTTPWSEWRCDPLPLLPCEIELPLAAGGKGAVRFELDDGDNAPLPRLDAELWRSRRELVFAWPAGGPDTGGAVELLAGAPGLAAPRYELAATADDLLARPAAAATLGVGGQGRDARVAFPRWTLLASLGLAAVVLLAVLGRAIAAPAGTRRPG